jgi:hypothetical protein
MNIGVPAVLHAAAIGIGATMLMDGWNLFLRRAFRIPSLSYCLLGRWIRHMTAGSFMHPDIAAAPPAPFECTVGSIAHYTIGVIFAVGFVVLVSGDWLMEPTLPPALLYGIGTIVFPFFLMQPAFGLGVAASKAANPTRARFKSLATHTVFGIGLYVCALGLSWVLLPASSR